MTNKNPYLVALRQIPAGFGLDLGPGFAIVRAAAACPRSTGASDDSRVDATNPAMMLRNCPKRYSAAATLGRPTKPATSPKRSSITAGRSLALLVTQAPERTA